MRQAFVPEVGKVDYRDVATPEIGPDDVLIRVQRVGICGSDQHVFHGLHPLVRPPLVQGHEFSGVVEATGAHVRGLASGDHVTVQPAIGCSSCPGCKAGLPGQCDNMRFVGGNIPGAMSTFIAVPRRQVYRFPDSVAAEDAAMTEPLAVAVRAINMGGPLDGSPVFVAGGGTIGQLVARVAQLKGAGRVIVSDPNPYRRACAEAAGCATLDPTAVADFVKEVTRLADGQAIHLAVECVGNTPALANCLQAVKRRSTLVICGVFANPPVLDMVKVQDQEITVKGSLMYSWSDFGEAVELISQGRIDMAPVQTHHVAFDGIKGGYDLLERPSTEAIKVFVDVE